MHGMWKPRRRLCGQDLPFGYYLDPNDPKWLLPDPEILAVIAKARKFYKERKSSIRGIQKWLEEGTGRRLSLRGTWKVMNRDF